MAKHASREQTSARASVRVFRVWYDACRENDAYRDESYTDDDGRFHERGGFWNDATGGRAALGITKADVTGCQRDLRTLARVKLPFVAVDAILSEAVMTRGMSLDTLERVASRSTWVRARRKNRARRRAAGFCGICEIRPASPKLDGSMGKTCQTCRDISAQAKVKAKMREELRAAGIL